MESHILPAIRLDLFDGGGAAAGTGAAAPSGGENGAQGENQTSPAPTRRGRTGGTQRILYGKQPGSGGSAGEAAEQPADAGQKQIGAQTASPAGTRRRPEPAAGRDGAAGTGAGPWAGANEARTAAPDPASDTLEARRKAFRELVSGEYKDVYTEETQRIIDRRFRETRELERQMKRQQPVIDLLMQRYKIGGGDLDRLTKALENDDAYWSEAAEEAGMSVEQFKRFQQLQRENAALLRDMREVRGRQAADRQTRQWYAEGEALKKVYPGFDLARESRNRDFLALLRSGIPVRHAYEVIHMEEIKAGVAAVQAKVTEKRVVAGIRARGARPAENGIAAQSAFTVKDDVSRLSRQDRAEIARRAQMGEKISF